MFAKKYKFLKTENNHEPYLYVNTQKISIVKLQYIRIFLHQEFFLAKMAQGGCVDNSVTPIFHI